MDAISAYYDAQFENSKSTGSIYQPFTVMLDAAHRHRMKMLDALPIGDISSKTVVDFGTGSWGFACIYPRLHQCAFAIGIDISAEAVRISDALSRNGSFPYGDRFKYYVSDGLSIPLANDSVDVFFTGECIEHVENTNAFLDEIYRVLRPEGIFILTTPNPHPVLYRSFSEQYAIGPEHIALMAFDELTAYLQPRFVIEVCKGSNASMHPTLDATVASVETAEVWAALHEEYPNDACGFIIQSRKKSGWTPRRCERVLFDSNHQAILYFGKWDIFALHEGLAGRGAKVDSSFSLKFSGIEIILLFWMHSWSGIVEIVVDGLSRKVDLYSSSGGFRRCIVGALSPDIEHQLMVRPTGDKNARSADHQVIFFSASSYS